MAFEQLWIDFVLAWFILFPAYAANAIPVLVRGKRPLDFGRMWKGKRILGDGKTIEGTAAGIAAGMVVGGAEWYLLPFFREIAGETALPEITLLASLAIAAGVMAGDIAGSFAKRRMGIPRGGKEPLLDRLGFIIFAVLFAYPLVSITPLMIFYMLTVTFVIHRLANIIAYNAHLKKVPW